MADKFELACKYIADETGDCPTRESGGQCEGYIDNSDECNGLPVDCWQLYFTKLAGQNNG